MAAIDRQTLQTLANQIDQVFKLQEVRDIQILVGGVVNNMYKIQEDSSVMVLRLYPPFFTEKLETEKFILMECQRLNLPTPRILKVDSSCQIFATPALLLTWIEGETLEDSLSTLTSDEIKGILREIHSLLKTLASLTQTNNIGYLHDGVLANKTNVKSYYLSQSTIYRSTILENGLLTSDEVERLITVLNQLLQILPLDKPVITYPDLSTKNIIVRDGRLAGIIDWEFIMGLNSLMAFGNLLLKTALNSPSSKVIIEYIQSLTLYDRQEIVAAAIFRGLELLSYLPNTKLFDEAEIKKKITNYSKSMEYIINLGMHDE